MIYYITFVLQVKAIIMYFQSDLAAASKAKLN
jgi:hypothetical protein